MRELVTPLSLGVIVYEPVDDSVELVAVGQVLARECEPEECFPLECLGRGERGGDLLVDLLANRMARERRSAGRGLGAGDRI